VVNQSCVYRIGSSHDGLGGAITRFKPRVLEHVQDRRWSHHGASNSESPDIYPLVFSFCLIIKYQPTASESGLTAIVAARSLYMRQHPEVPAHDLVLYVTSMTHSFGAKAASILHLSLRTLDVSAEDNFSLRGATLRAALEEDEARGRRPFFLGGFDPCFIYTSLTDPSQSLQLVQPILEQLIISGRLDKLVCLPAYSNHPHYICTAQDHPSLWIHVDAAWAGMALSCPEYRELCQLEAINQYANSFCANFHKVSLWASLCLLLTQNDVSSNSGV
jgi:aromatic-L-amino-acid decarboxylase